MNRLNPVAGVLFAGLAAFSPFSPFSLVASAQATDYRQIKTPALHAVSIPQPKRIQLDNGMVIFLEEDHELPLIRGTAKIRGGNREVPAARAGLESIYSEAWRTGGTESKNGDQLDDFLEARAAKVETGGGADSTSVSFDSLKGDFDTVFPIFVELLRKPAFRQDKVDLAKTQIYTGISRRNDDPNGIAGRELRQLGFGKDSGYTREPEYATVSAITREDLIAFHHQYVHPNNIIVGIVGDFDSAVMEKKLRDAFGSWLKGPQAQAYSEVAHPAAPGVYFVAKDDVTQSTVMMAHAGISRRNPDYYAIQVMNEILGGGFSGRLLNDIRTKRGLAYSAGGGVGSSWDHDALFVSEMSTKSGSTVEAINAMKEDLSTLATQPFTADELSQAKDTLLNSFVFSVDSPERMLGQRMVLEFYGYPADYWQRYVPAIQGVTVADVTRVAKQYVTPDKLRVLVVGNQKDFDKPLSSLGEVHTLDITIPDPPAAPGASPMTPVVDSGDGRALLEKVHKYVGAGVDAVKSVSYDSTVHAKTPQGPMTIDIHNTTIFPDRQQRIMTTAMGEVTMVMTANSAFALTPGGAQDIPPAQRENGLRDVRSDVLNVLSHSSDPMYTYSTVGRERVGDVDAEVLVLGFNGKSTKWWIDPASGRLLRRQVTSSAPGGAETVMDYTAWKKVGDINVPVKYVVHQGSDEVATGELTNVMLNPKVDDLVWTKPAK